MTKETGEISTLKRLQEGGLTWRVLLFSFPFCFAWLFVFQFGTYGGLKTYDSPPLLLMILVEAAIIRLLGKRFGLTIQEWTVFLTIAMSGLLTSSVLYDRDGHAWGGMVESWVSAFGRFFFGCQTIIKSGYPLPAPWFPTDATLLAGFAAGGITPPWAAWLPYIIFWIAIMIPFWLAFHFISTLFRKGFIEEEKLPFPYAVENITLLQMSKGHGRSSLFDLKSRSGKAFWLAFLVGGIWPAYLWGANLTAGSRHTFGPATIWARPFSNGIQLSPYLGTILPGYNWDWGVSQYTSWFPMFYFFSMDVLTSLLITIAIFAFIIPGIMMNTGMGIVGQLRFYGTSVSPIPWAVMFQGAFANNGYGGFFFGLAAWLFWHYRKHIIYTIKSAIGGDRRESNEPYSWRFVWIGLILCIAVWYGVMLSSGMSPLIFINLLITLFVVFPAVTRIAADMSRVVFGSEQVYVAAMYRDSWAIFGSDVANKADPNLIGQQWWSVASNNAMVLQGTGHPQATMTAYKYADSTGTHASPVGFAYIAAIIIGFIFSIPAVIWMSYNWSQATLFLRVPGLNNGGEVGVMPISFIGTRVNDLVVYGSGVKQPNYQLWVGVGAIVTFALFWMRSSFTWFFFNPIVLGFPDAGLAGATGGFGSVLIMWTAKWLTFKVGGVKAYDEVGVPAVVGYISAIAFWQFLWLCVVFTSF